MGGRKAGGALTALALVLSALLAVIGAGALYLVLTSQPGPEAPAPAQDALRPKTFQEYGWDELAEVARTIAAADDPEAVAAEWGIEVGDVRPLALTDGRQASLTVVGIACDERADGEGLLTWGRFYIKHVAQNRRKSVGQGSAEICGTGARRKHGSRQSGASPKPAGRGVSGASRTGVP